MLLWTILYQTTAEMPNARKKLTRLDGGSAFFRMLARTLALPDPDAEGPNVGAYDLTFPVQGPKSAPVVAT